MEQDIMTQVNTFGKCKSITVFDDKREGQMILRTPSGDVTLKISDDHLSSFDGMAAIATAGVEFATGNPGSPPNIHVKYDDGDMEVDEMTLHYHI